MSEPKLNAELTQDLIDRVMTVRDRGLSSFAASAEIAPFLGARLQNRCVEFGFWVPELVEWHVPDHDILLEILEPLDAIDLKLSRQSTKFKRYRLSVSRIDDLVFAAVEGLVAGTRKTTGHFYALTYRDADGIWQRILDPLAASLPFGAMAPAEIYDSAKMQRDRNDSTYFDSLAASQTIKMPVATNILQIHIPTATAGGTLESLRRHYQHLAHCVRNDTPLTPEERIFLGYDAVQLLPVEPTTVYETGPDFWQESASTAEALSVELLRPNTTNWGYDVVIAGSAAVSPTLLETGRPDELVDFIAELHNFPGQPIRVIFDVVYGHSDNQGLRVLNSQFFAGPNMYGQDLAYRRPMVRAILLEMQRRKVNFGADGVRVDGAQDFKWWDADAWELRHDDEYLQSMADVTQDVAGCRYRPWFIFEDGRPWPQEDWELSSTYRAVIDNQDDPDVFQWGPLTFAHNTPFIYGFWLSKWWRIQEILKHGSNWISGCSNHDTLRRGTQVSPKLAINTRLGDTKMEILDKAYDNPAVELVTYAAFPGVPMDFLNARARASWGFIRNQDDKYGVKVVAEEAISLKWQIDDKTYDKPGNFRRLKAMGFDDRDKLARFLEFLPGLVEVTEYDLQTIVTLLNSVVPPVAGPTPVTVKALKTLARSWMDDMHEYCNLSHAHGSLSDQLTRFFLDLREFRRARPWLRDNLAANDVFTYREPVRGTVLFQSLRHGPEGEQVFMVANMEGDSVEDFDPLSLPVAGLEGDGWHLALRTPPIGGDYIGGPLTLKDSVGLVFTRKLK